VNEMAQKRDVEYFVCDRSNRQLSTKNNFGKIRLVVKPLHFVILL